MSFKKQRQEIQQKKQQSSEDTKHGDLNEARQAAKDRNIKTHRPGLDAQSKAVQENPQRVKSKIQRNPGKTDRQEECNRKTWQERCPGKRRDNPALNVLQSAV